MAILTPQEIQHYMQELKDWELGMNHIHRLIVFPDFSSAMEFVNRVARLAIEENHHPDISISYNKVHLVLWTRNSHSVSEKDFHLAAKINGSVR